MGLFEALSHPSLLADAQVAERMAAALLGLARSGDHGGGGGGSSGAATLSAELAEGGRFPGLYLLAAYPDPAVRALVGAGPGFRGAGRGAVVVVVGVRGTRWPEEQLRASVSIRAMRFASPRMC